MVIHPIRSLRFALQSLLPVSVISCNKVQVFQVNGVVRAVLPERQQVKIEHEKIPGYMDAMTMPFDVKDAKELDGIQAGDKVSFRMIVTEKEGWIAQIKKTGTAVPIAAP